MICAKRVSNSSDRLAKRKVAGRDHLSQAREDRFRIRELLRQYEKGTRKSDVSNWEQIGAA